MGWKESTKPGDWITVEPGAGVGSGSRAYVFSRRMYIGSGEHHGEIDIGPAIYVEGPMAAVARARVALNEAINAYIEEVEG